tara:strand:- start:137 stop:679 length:543 start_codon:yes stop_codon:yes gene_type:complete
MDVQKYIMNYSDVVPDELCKEIIGCTDTVFTPSTYSNHKGKVKSEERVRMDEFWVRKDGIFYDRLKVCFEKVISRYSVDFPLFSVHKITDFRINRYAEGGFMSKHIDNIHHSHGQEYGFPQVSVLLYLNDDYEGGEFKVADKLIYPEAGSGIIFPSNFMYPHEAEVVTKGTRWSIVAWLM